MDGSSNYLNLQKIKNTFLKIKNVSQRYSTSLLTLRVFNEEELTYHKICVREDHAIKIIVKIIFEEQILHFDKVKFTHINA